VPALFLAAVSTGRYGARHRVAVVPAAAAIIAIAVVGWEQVARQVPNGGWLRLPAPAIFRSEVYVIIGLGALLIAAAGELTAYRWCRGRPGAAAARDPGG
jgi:hypothetical protein